MDGGTEEEGEDEAGEGGRKGRQANILLVVEIEIERGGYSAGFICTQYCNRYQQ